VFVSTSVLQPGVNTLLGGVITSNGIDGEVGDSIIAAGEIAPAATRTTRPRSPRGPPPCASAAERRTIAAIDALPACSEEALTRSRTADTLLGPPVRHGAARRTLVIMRFHALLAGALLAGAATAQVALPPHANVYNGYSRGFSFTAATPFAIVGLDLPTDAFQAGDTASYLVRVNGATALWSRGNVGAIATNIPVVNGDVVDVIGNWSPVGANSFTAHNSYGNTAPFATTIEGVPHTLNRTGWQWDIGDTAWVATGATGTYLAPTTGQLGRVLMFTSSGGSGTVLATNTTLGQGCGQTFNSVYEYFPNATLASAALTGNSLTLVSTASGYVTQWLPGTAAALFVPPSGAATPLATGDDGDVALTPSVPLSTPYGAQPTLRVSGNGVIAFGSAIIDFPGTVSYTPTSAGFLNSVQGGVYAWHDYNVAEPGSGSIVAEEMAGVLYVTYNGVENYANPEVANPSTLQFQLNLATGHITIVFVAIDGNATSAFGSSILVGVTAPGASQEPGSVGLASGPYVTSGPEAGRLTLAAASRPITNTSWNLSVTNVPATGAIGIDVFGLADPGLVDLGFLGAPGCGARASLDVLNAWIVAGPSHAYSLAVPNNVALVNFHVYTMGVVLVPGVNALLGGAITSNGVDGKIGDF
jgi:hypothetical protein